MYEMTRGFKMSHVERMKLRLFHDYDSIFVRLILCRFYFLFKACYLINFSLYTFAKFVLLLIKSIIMSPRLAYLRGCQRTEEVI